MNREMDQGKALVAFEKHSIRRFYDESEEAWYFSVVDVVGALTDSVNPRDYWFKMKIRVKTEDGFELSTICRQLKLTSADGKKYATDCANVEGLFRIISTRQIAESVVATGMPENAAAGKKGGRIAKRARRELEQKTGKSVVTGENFLPPGQENPKIGNRE